MGLTPSSAAGLVTAAGATVLSGFILKRILDGIHNDARKTRIIEDLSLNDPLLKTIDKATLYRWYALLDYYAPSLANDKLTTQEVLQNFARFGKVDFNTIKMLIETENKLVDTSKLHADTLKSARQALI